MYNLFITGITALNKVKKNNVHSKLQVQPVRGLTSLQERVCISAYSLKTGCFWQVSEVNNTGGLKCTCWISFRVIHRVSGRAGNMDKPISGSKFSEEFCTEAWPIIWNHYIWYSMSYIKLFGYCDNALCSLGFKLLVFNPLRVLINSGEVCSSPILRQIYAYSLPRTTGEGGRHQGFLCTCEAQFDLSSIDPDSPGHQTVIRALARHSLMPRWPRWMQSSTSSLKTRGMTMHSLWRSRSSTTTWWALCSQYGRSKGCCGMYSGHPSWQNLLTCEHSSSLFWAFLISWRRCAVAGRLAVAQLAKFSTSSVNWMSEASGVCISRNLTFSRDMKNVRVVPHHPETEA